MEAIVAGVIGALIAVSVAGACCPGSATTALGAGSWAEALSIARRADDAMGRFVGRLPRYAVLWIGRLERTCSRMPPSHVSEYPHVSLAVLLALSAGLAWWASGMVAGGVIGAVLCVAALVVACLREEKRRADNIERGLPEAFRALSISIGSGHSLAQAMRYVGAHAEEPVKTEFMRVGLSIDCGVPAVETLDILLSRLPVHGMDMVTLALKISKRTGAPLSGLLADAANSVGERIELRRTLDVKTAQARMSAHIVSAMPMGMMAFLLLFSSDFRAGVATMPGLFCVVAALTLNVVAVVIIGKIMRMEL